MKRRSQIVSSIQQHISTLLIVLSLIMATANSFYLDQDEKDIAEETSQKTDDPNEAKATLELSVAIQPHFQINLSFQSLLLDVVPVFIEKVEVRELVSQFVLSQSKSFKILLQRIISTNAP